MVRLLENLTQGPMGVNAPPHVGEVMSLWTYYTAAEAVRAQSLTMLNHKPDPDLAETVERFANNVLADHTKQITQLMKQEGIPFPARPPEVPKTHDQEIPPGAEFTDMAIANRLVADLEALIITANVGLLQSLRGDIGALFLLMHGQLLALGGTLKKVMQKRGWLHTPPPYFTRQADPQ